MERLRSNTRPSFAKLKKWLTGLFILTCASMLTACASQMPPLPDRPPLPASLLTPCPPLPDLTDGQGETVLRTFLDVSYLYYDCKAKHAALVDAVAPPLKDSDK